MGLTAMILSSVAIADMKVEVTLPSDREYFAFESPAWPRIEPKLWPLAKKKDTLTLPTMLTKSNLFLLDKEKGRLAVISTVNIKGGKWAPTLADFNVIDSVKLSVVTAKGPIGVASVEIQSNASKFTELIDPASGGSLTLKYVPAGELRVAVSYKVDGKSQEPVASTFKVDASKEMIPAYEVSVPNAVPASGINGVGTAVADGNAPKGESATVPVSGVNPLGNILSTLFGLAFVVGVGYFVVKYMRSNEDKVKETLVKLGADLPKAGDPATDSQTAAPSTPFVPTAPQPVQQIILDPVATVTDSGLAVGGVSSVLSNGLPTLVTRDGSRFELPEGETVVGREFGNGLVVASDTVSRRHASLFRSGNSASVVDHGSTNGTWVNGAKVAGNHELRVGDSVRFGSVEYRFEG